MTNWDITVNISIERAPATEGASDASAVAAMFGLNGRNSPCVETLYEDFRLVVAPGQIVAVVGPSGSGKTTLLRAVAEAVADSIPLRLDALSKDSRPTVACLETRITGRTPAAPESLADRLAVLSRCGLAEATALVTPARCLSGGQLYRLALAEAIWRSRQSGRPRLLLADEFASGLDGPTAAVLAAGVRKLIRRDGLAMILSTPRQELLKIIQPDQVIVKPLGEAAFLAEPGDAAGHPARRWRIERGTIRDYRALGRFHYLAGPPAAHKRVWIIRVPKSHRVLGSPAVAAVLVVSPPVLNCRGRNVATRRRYAGRDRATATRLLNAEIECISRVVVHPIYRGCGLAVRLVRHALRHAGMPLVEALAAMGAVHPFFSLAGMADHGRFPGQTQTYNYYLAKTGRKTGVGNHGEPRLKSASSRGKSRPETSTTTPAALRRRLPRLRRCLTAPTTI